MARVAVVALIEISDRWKLIRVDTLENKFFKKIISKIEDISWTDFVIFSFRTKSEVFLTPPELPSKPIFQAMATMSAIAYETHNSRILEHIQIAAAC